MFFVLKIVICLVKCISAANLSGHINDGQFSEIWQFPHSVVIDVDCLFVRFRCGSSILNQFILLTAAHCVEDCSNPEVLAYAGHKHSEKGVVTLVAKTVMHENYDRKTVSNDIGLLLLRKKLIFNKNIRRILLMRRPPFNNKDCYVAGWGRETPDGSYSIYLKHVSQRVYKRDDCYKIGIFRVPNGTICAENLKKKGNADLGDSGGALVTAVSPNIQIQIGIVSFSKPGGSDTHTVYTDTGYFYNWITKHSKLLYCDNN